MTHRPATPSHSKIDLLRRRLLQGIGLTLPLSMAGCAGMTAPGPGRSAPQGASVELLYYADTLDALAPSIPPVAATRIGPSSRMGRAPWATGAGISAIAGVTPPDFSTTPRAATTRPLGGYATLAALLADWRQRLGEQRCLTLENGQCWNGAGLGHLSQGDGGVASSQLFGSDVRVSSEERVLWPERVEALYRRYARPVLGRSNESATAAGVVPVSYFERGGARIGVVGATDPYAADESRPLDAWYLAIESGVAKARASADLVIVLADTGTGPGLWLAQRLDQADLLLCARGQDFWPTLVEVDQAHGGRLPVCFPGSRGMGAYRIQARSQAGRWQFEATFLPAEAKQLSSAAQTQRQTMATEVGRWRAPYADWLDRPVGRAPEWLWRRDATGGSWDALIAEALSGGDPGTPTLSPGLRHDVVLPPDATLTRDHLLALSGGHAALVFPVSLDHAALTGLLERAADQCFGTPILLDNSEDLPRLTGVDWTCRYGAETGQRIQLADAPRTDFVTWSARAHPSSGEPLWQLMERHLQQRDTRPLASPNRPRMPFVEGHPGWHPELRLES
ncbi:hypothetical protein [Salinicola halophilus]|uniref:hypothetical protein n=1 Tax=Salinicola halophilus TaxID=184065 RepID=UPI00195502D9|nr:hypothetical protein [Salinicola halophilus]